MSSKEFREQQRRYWLTFAVCGAIVAIIVIAWFQQYRSRARAEIAATECRPQLEMLCLSRGLVMTKEKKSASELSNLVAVRVGIGGLYLSVNESPVYGWDAAIIASPAQATNTHAIVQQIVAELRELYDLRQ
jgi:hypothetical protein